MTQVHKVRKPRRWDRPFGRERMQSHDLRRLLSLPIFTYIDQKEFPADLALTDILANDGRIIRYARGDIIFRQGEYGNSVFIVLRGSVRGLLTSEGERTAFQQELREKKSWLQLFSQLWRNSKVSEGRDLGGHKQPSPDLDHRMRLESDPTVSVSLRRNKLQRHPGPGDRARNASNPTIHRARSKNRATPLLNVEAIISRIKRAAELAVKLPRFARGRKRLSGGSAGPARATRHTARAPSPRHAAPVRGPRNAPPAEDPRNNEYRELARYEPPPAPLDHQARLNSDRAVSQSSHRYDLERYHRPNDKARNASKHADGLEGLMRRVSEFLNREQILSRIEDIDGLIAKFPTFSIGSNGIFGESAALTRTPRSNSVFADEDETLLLELRWPGLRDIRHWSDSFRNEIDGLYRVRSLLAGLRESSLFENVDEATLTVIAEHSRFETHGNFGWTHHYQREIASANGSEQIIQHEPIISEQDHYLDSLLLIQSGFARVSEKFDHGEKTIGYLTKGDEFGLAEITNSVRSDEDRKLRRSLRAIGYVDVIRIPTQIVETYLLPTLPAHKKLSPLSPATADPIAVRSLAQDAGLQQSMLNFFVDNRFVNGTKAMAINTDRCVNCDDCVRACAATHDDISRFVRHGMSHQNLMIANACMHCVDPVCLIDCPTDAIHRDPSSGCVVIDDATCVGCAACANACPYNNIRMAELRDSSGAFLIDEEGVQVVRATKCDFCVDQLGGPACQRACPHDALIRVDIQDMDKLSNWLNLEPI